MHGKQYNEKVCGIAARPGRVFNRGACGLRLSHLRQPVGYVIIALRKTRSTSFAINVSIAIRLAYHLYQGSISLINIIPMGIIYAYWFARTGRLWPLVIAHGIFDFIAFALYTQH